MKGSLEGVLPMIGLLLIAVILAIQTMPIGSTLNQVVSESADDISELVETQAGYDHFTNYFVPDSSKFAINNAAYTLQDGGINWESEAASAVSRESILSSIINEWEREAHSKFNDRIADFSCSVNSDLNYEVYPGSSEPGYDFYSMEFENVSALTYDFSGIELSCNPNTEYRTESYSSSISTPNRYIELAKASSTFFYRVEDEFSSADIQSSYTASGSACGSRSDAFNNARSSASSSYSSDTPSASNIASSISLPDGISLDTNQDDNYHVSSTNPTTGDCCSSRCTNYDEEGECTSRTCTAERKHDEVTISTTNTVIDMEVLDYEEEVLTKDGYQSLVIEETNYRIDH